MANWQGAARTNYFFVKNEKQFKAWADNPPNMEIGEKDGRFMLMSTCPDTGAFTQYVYDDETGHEYDVDLTEIAQFLEDGQVAIFMEAGAEKLRCITGWAMAVSWDGRVENVSIDDIYEKAANAFGVNRSSITACSY
jgi:hypothetical protein